MVFLVYINNNNSYAYIEAKKLNFELSVYKIKVERW